METMENHGKPSPVPGMGSLAETGRPTRPSTLKVAPGLAGIRRIEGCLQTVDTFLRCSAQAAQMQNHTGLPSLPLHGRVELHYSTIPYFSNGRLHLSQHLIEFCLTKGSIRSKTFHDSIRHHQTLSQIQCLGKWCWMCRTYSTASVSRMRSIAQASFSFRSTQICSEKYGRNLSRLVLLSLQSSTSVTDLLHTSPPTHSPL